MGQYCFARCRLSSSVTLPAGGIADRPPGAWAVRWPTLHSGPVRLRPVSAIPCSICVVVAMRFTYREIINSADLYRGRQKEIQSGVAVFS